MLQLHTSVFPSGQLSVTGRGGLRKKLSSSRGPPPSAPAMDCVPPYVALHVDCTTVCQKYIQRYNAKYVQLNKKKGIHTNISSSPSSNGITNHVPDLFDPFF